MPDALDIKQQAVTERRHWVRLTRACNNRCAFCLDSGAHDGLALPESVVREKLQQGRDSGATRLILSGGEPTIHPKFLDFVALGRALGYTWIQTVSNGRMFSYERFTRQALDAGLREATLSMHAHTPDLYAQLTGIHAFPQALKGLVNLVRGGAVVSVDIVLTRLNLPVLKEILQFYMDLGVYEFDLLHLVPFGRGFDDNRDLLFADDDTIRDGLARALELADTPGLFLWTNRLPIRYLEGHEDLFQDPHKLYDEVLGEREAFKRLFADGTPPECLGDRCPHCFLLPFCQAARAVAAGERGQPRPDGELVLDAATAESLLALDDPTLAARTAAGLRIATREDYREAIDAAPSLEQVRALASRLPAPIRGLPPCLGGPRAPEPPAPLGADELDDDGRIRLAPFVGFFIREGYRVKSLRCRSCAADATCPGLHVNLARHWGLRALSPLAE